MFKKNFTDYLVYFLWDLWCVVSIVGIWPRFIEPRLLRTTRKKLAVKDLPPDLEGLRIVQFGDLHLAPHSSKRYLAKIQRRIAALNPDLLLFSGDFLCYSESHDWDLLSQFLAPLSARYGCFASLGNHDYAEYAALRPDGTRVIRRDNTSPLVAGAKRLVTPQEEIQYEESHEPLSLHTKLLDTLTASPFTVLENETTQVEIGKSRINITGLGDIWTGNFDPVKGFTDYDPSAPGVILSHNPDTAAALADHPGELVLSGHTHGAQVNLPWFRKRFLSLQNMNHYRGEHRVGDKTLYVNRGCGAVFFFRWCSIPEITLFELERAP